MNSRLVELLVGLFVLIGMIAITFLAIRIGGGRFFSNDSYLVKARFTDIGGLSTGSKVQIAGVRVGTVSGITIDQEDFAAVVDLRIDNDVTLDEDTIASIRTQGLIGDKYVGLLPGGSGMELQAGDVIIDTESAVDIEGLISKVAFGSINTTSTDGTNQNENDDQNPTTNPDTP